MTTQLATFLQDALGADFRIEQELDGGGMSRVFLATDLRHDRRVVVKVLSHELASETSSARFKREIELTVRLQHPHILPILTSGARDDMLYYISPFIPGESLRARIARDGKLPLADVVKFLRDVSGALAFAHQRGIVHRDVKPGNILLAEGHAILADFGIARAVSTTATPLTGSGMVPGTPAYMAPELPTDEKADVYALGVVAYEMLCGALPKRGFLAKDVLAGRGHIADDSTGRLRELAELVADAASSAPDRRIQTAQEFCERLETIGVHARRSSRRRVSAIAGAAIIVTAGAFFALRPTARAADRYAIVDLTSRDSGSAADALRHAMAEWRGVTLADPVATKGRVDAAQARDAARRAGASSLVMVETTRDRDSVIVQATLRDAVGDTTIRVRRVAYAASAPSAERLMTFRRLANSMLRERDEIPWTDASDPATPSLAAWRGYDRGRQLLAEWRLAQAESAFVTAMRAEPRLGPAFLWYAQTLEWSNPQKRSPDIKAAALHALDSGAPLRAADSLHASALAAMASGDFPRACSAFESMRRTDSTSVVAWMGLGDCRAFDSRVVPDKRSPSGWVFRGSFESAARSYQRAADFGPVGATADFQGFMLNRLSGVLYPFTNYLRLGRAASDSTTYGGLPYLNADTLAFAPLPTDQLANQRIGQDPAAVQAAGRRSRALMRHAAEEWVRRAPQSAAAYDSLATWVEVSGGQATIAEQQVATLDVVRRGLELSRDSTQRIHLGVSEVRLLLKNGDVDAARAAAESLLKAGAGRHAPYVDGVAGLAVLLGRVREASELLARDPDNARVVAGPRGVLTLPAQLATVRAGLMARAALGVPGDSIPVMARQIEELAASYFPDTADAAALRNEILGTALTLSYPVGSSQLKLLSAPHVSSYSMFFALARGDAAQAKTLLADAQRRAAGFTQGTSIDMNYRRATIALAVGDTAAALRELDPVLHALPTLAPSLLSQVTQAGALVRALVMRADVAAARRDAVTATQCATAVATLWGGADVELRPVVRRMKALAQ